MISSRALFLIIPIGIAGAIGFEHIRFFLTQRQRKERRKSYWEYFNIAHTDTPMAIFDYLLQPLTYIIGWYDDNLKTDWTLFGSLTVAGRFVNPFKEWEDRNTTDIIAYLKWQLTRKNLNGIPNEAELAETMPIFKPNFELLNELSSASHLRALNLTDSLSSWSVKSSERITLTWIGQSTCFVQMDGYNILTDPVFSPRTMGDWLGPMRLRPTPCKLSDLPPIDIVLISHNHYDHLDVKSMREIGNKALWYVPKGLKIWMESNNITNCIELDWWQEHWHDENLLIAATPIQHWSGRHFFDVNSTLWSSFVIKTKHNSFFHCGDTGYCSVFKEIGRKYGPITLAALPIGSYEPRYFMCHQHMNPEEACLVHQDIQAQKSIGVHWGTFMMSDEHYLDPPKDLKIAKIKLSLPTDAIITTNIGETIQIKNAEN